MDNNKKINNNSNNRITLLMLLITSLIIVNFTYSRNPFVITVEIIICLALLVILCLADSFDNLSIPKIISLSKNIKEVKKENSELKEANIKLLEQVTTIKNSNNQNFYFPDIFSTVSSSNIDDINKNEENDVTNDQIENDNLDNTPEQKISVSERRKYKLNLKIFLLKKALHSLDENNDNINIQYEVKLINNKLIDDSIMKNEIRFDALKSSETENIFYEVKISPFVLDYSYQLQYMLRTLELYKDFNKIPSKLVLLLPKMDKDLEALVFNSNRDRFTIVRERIEKRFEPAIKNNLLEILDIEVSKNELDKYIKNKEK